MCPYNQKKVSYFDRRKKDVERTERVSKKIDEILRAEEILFIRNYDAKLQKKGVDLITFPTGVPRNVDEKYAINYWNKNLKTYSFEIYSTNNVKNNGWFTSDNNITQDYMLVWLKATDESLENIYQLEMAFIEKDAIVNYLAENGVDLNTILDEFFENCTEKENKKEMIINRNIKVVQSLKFLEAPVNIIISKDVLLSLSYCSLNKHFSVDTKQKIA